MLRYSGHPSMLTMNHVKRVLVANELASYRESIAAVLRMSRPGVEIFEADSGDLNREVLRTRPDLVICSRVTRLVEDRVPNWVELYPECTPSSTTVYMGEDRSTLEQVELSDLLAIVDRAQPLARSA